MARDLAVVDSALPVPMRAADVHGFLTLACPGGRFSMERLMMDLCACGTADIRRFAAGASLLALMPPDAWEKELERLLGGRLTVAGIGAGRWGLLLQGEARFRAACVQPALVRAWSKEWTGAAHLLWQGASLRSAVLRALEACGQDLRREATRLGWTVA